MPKIEIEEHELAQLKRIDLAARAFVDACPSIKGRCLPVYDALLRALYDGRADSSTGDV